jgi:hypothetical protein
MLSHFQDQSGAWAVPAHRRLYVFVGGSRLYRLHVPSRAVLNCAVHANAAHIAYQHIDLVGGKASRHRMKQRTAKRRSLQLHYTEDNGCPCAYCRHNVQSLATAAEPPPYQEAAASATPMGIAETTESTRVLLRSTDFVPSVSFPNANAELEAVEAALNALPRLDAPAIFLVEQ